MSKRFPHSSGPLLHLLWFNAVGRHPGASSTVATPSARSFCITWAVPGVFTPPGPCQGYWCKGRGLQGLRGTSTQAEGWLPNTAAVGSPQLHPSLTIINTLPSSFLFHLLYLQSAVSQFHRSLFCPQNQEPHKMHFKRDSGSEKDQVCVLSIPLLCPRRQRAPVSEGTLLLRNCRIKLMRASIEKMGNK